MVFLFRDKSIINILFVLLLCLLVHGHGFFLPVTVEANLNTGYFGFLLQHYLKPLLGTSGFWVYILIVMIQALRLNFLLAEQKMYPNSSYTVAMTYVLLTGLFPDWSVISPALLANFLLIWIYIKLTRLYNNPAPKTLLFNIGLLVAIMVLSYHPTALVVPVVLFALGIMRAFKLQEWFTDYGDGFALLFSGIRIVFNQSVVFGQQLAARFGNSPNAYPAYEVGVDRFVGFFN